MNREVNLTFRYGPGEYLRAVNAHQRTRMHVAADLAFSVIFLACGLWAFSAGGVANFWLGVALCGIASALPVLAAIFYFVLPRTMIAGYERLRDEYQLTFSNDGVRFRTKGVDSRIDWCFYKSAAVMREFYLLYYSRRQFTVIPKRAFANPADMQALDALLAAHVPAVQRKAQSG
jgi:hypothetical protein